MYAIIPARGGSKGLPGKNIKELNGLPLIAHTIRAAISSKHIKKVFVSTDDKEILNIALNYGAIDIGLRPESLATDDAKAIDTYIYTIRLLESKYNEPVDDICVLQPTSPLRGSDDIDNAIDIFRSKNADSVISFTAEHHPISWHKYLNDDLTLSNIFPENNDNRQSFRQTVFPNGAIYIFKKELLLSGNYSSEKTYAYMMPRNRSVDIDTIDDFRYAEFLVKGND